MPRKSLRFTGPANGHPRFGSRATRTASKLGRAISLRRLEQLLAEAKASQ